MKFKLIITSISFLIYFTLLKVINFFYSPISGIATAQSLNDDIPSFAFAKFVRDGNLDGLLLLFLIASLIIIWYPKNVTNKNR